MPADRYCPRCRAGCPCDPCPRCGGVTPADPLDPPTLAGCVGWAVLLALTAGRFLLGRL